VTKKKKGPLRPGGWVKCPAMMIREKQRGGKTATSPETPGKRGGDTPHRTCHPPIWRKEKSKAYPQGTNPAIRQGKNSDRPSHNSPAEVFKKILGRPTLIPRLHGPERVSRNGPDKTRTGGRSAPFTFKQGRLGVKGSVKERVTGQKKPTGKRRVKRKGGADGGGGMTTNQGGGET